MAQRSSKPSTQIKYYPFNGGLDVVTPALSVDPGFALALVNFEPYFNGGYRRIDGYERFDGHTAPSTATFQGGVLSYINDIVTAIGASGTGTLGTGIGGTGLTSGATGQFVEGVSVSGTGWVALTNVSGTFTAGEHVRYLSGTNISTSTGTFLTAPSLNFAPSGTGTTGYPYSSEFLFYAQNFYRRQIGQVQSSGAQIGTGSVLGGWQNGTNIFAARQAIITGTQTSSTVAYLFKSTGTGWAPIVGNTDFATTVYYGNLGTQGLPATGSLIKGVTSGAQGTLYSGVSHTTSAGYIALMNVVGGTSGGFVNGESLIAGTTTAGTLFSTALSNGVLFQPSTGFYRWRNYNFFGSSATYHTYAVNGVGPAFQMDFSSAGKYGSQYAVVMPILMPLNPLTNQPSANSPFLVEVYQGMLMLAFPGGVYQSSVAGQPTQFNAFLGANQFSTGAEITSMYSIAGPGLALATTKNQQILSGNTAATFLQTLVAEHAGSVLNGAQSLDTVYSLGSLGITSLARTQSYGNFAGSTVSQLVQPIVNALRPNFTDATIARAYNEARFYFNDGSILIMYVPGLGQQNKAWSALESGVTAQFGYAQYPVPVYNICNSEDNVGNEVAYFSSSNADGYLYKDRSGSSFDGNAVTSYARLAFNNIGTPAVRKYFRRADIEINATSAINLKFVADLTYSSEESSSAVTALTAANITPIGIFGAASGYYDTLYWNQFTWDGLNISNARASLAGTGENISFLIYHQAIVDNPFVLQGMTLHYDPRRLQR